MTQFPTSDPILAKQVTSKDFEGDIFDLGLYVDIDSHRVKPFQKTIRYHLNLDDDYNLKKLTKAKTKFLIWGQEGTGKTTELKYLIKKCEEKLKSKNTEDDYYVPIYIKTLNLFNSIALSFSHELNINIFFSLIEKDLMLFKIIFHYTFATKQDQASWLEFKEVNLDEKNLLSRYKVLVSKLTQEGLENIISSFVNSFNGDGRLNYLFIIDDINIEDYIDEYESIFANTINEHIIIATSTYIKPKKAEDEFYQFTSLRYKSVLGNVLNKRIKNLIETDFLPTLLDLSAGNPRFMFEIFNQLLTESVGNKISGTYLNMLFNKKLIPLTQIAKFTEKFNKLVKKPNHLSLQQTETYFNNLTLFFYENYEYQLSPFYQKLIYASYNENVTRPLSIQNHTVALSLSKIKIANFRGIKDLLIEDIEPKSNFIFILGENGYGKTSLLQSIALGFIGDTDKNKIMIDENERKTTSIDLEYYDLDELMLSSYSIKTKLERYFTAVFCYGSSRLSVQDSQSKNEVNEKSSSMYGLFYDNNTMLDIEYELSSRWEQTDNRFLQTQALFKQLMPNLKEIRVNANKDIEYFEIDNSQPLRFNQLSAASKANIALFGDLIIKFLKQYPETIHFADFEGIVIIDELELHLHPKWQRELPNLLAGVFPKVQFIVSTHSVFPILGAPKASVFIKVYRNDIKGVWAEKIDIDPTNLTPNILFTSPLFDMDSILSVNNQDIRDVRFEENMEEMKFADEIKARLKAITGKNVPANILRLPN
jgi:predicted ATP-binding protein involved in virulence